MFRVILEKNNGNVDTKKTNSQLENKYSKIGNSKKSS